MNVGRDVCRDFVTLAQKHMLRTGVRINVSERVRLIGEIASDLGDQTRAHPLALQHRVDDKRTELKSRQKPPRLRAKSKRRRRHVADTPRPFPRNGKPSLAAWILRPKKLTKMSSAVLRAGVPGYRGESTMTKLNDNPSVTSVERDAFDAQQTRRPTTSFGERRRWVIGRKTGPCAQAFSR